MSRIVTPPVESASGATAELFSQISKAAGRVPNAYAAIGAHNPAALKAILQADSVPGTLSRQEKEVIKLAVSSASGCDYCQAAHFLVGKLAGVPQETLKQVIADQSTGNVRFDALTRFVRKLASNPGTLADEAFTDIKSAGFSDAEIVEIGLVVSVITFTNIFNRVNDTTIDFPKIP
jgi:uncharacterized peroxidase-related enzyme